MATAPRRRRAATTPVDLTPDADPVSGAAALRAPAARTARAELEDFGVPEPTAIKTVWLRASLMLPGATAPINDRKIYIALVEPGVTGLYVYKTVPEDDFTPEWFAYMPVQAEPIRGAMARNGIQLATDQGPVIITPSGACSCSAPLKRWTPQFAQRMVRWSA
jgi:hypothetical protein